ncbi:hypothetical protein SFOMI_1510 [Sphingobium fuliginis]|uniref:Uncharacterized protein n=1 Tax=Sphingobium fuliginis (strain ATCC 27551) TaxID=336203 RepID=A0A292ZDN0_SPHSA|nr:hypothetical protein SFOMI_1510 [Sphingobium fuliginis]
MISSIFYSHIGHEDISFLTAMIERWVDRRGFRQVRPVTRWAAEFQATPQSGEIELDAIREIPGS